MSYGLERGLSARSAIPILRAWHDKQAREREMLKTKLFRAVVEISRDLYEDSRAEMLDGRHTTAALLERTSDAVINDAAAALAEPTLLPIWKIFRSASRRRNQEEALRNIRELDSQVG
jgi:hypothetical protein